MKPAITPIQTTYKGYRFRSRLEARWAVFMDRLGIGWEYETEGFHLPHGNYLPDFWLPSLCTWLEIKPAGLESPLARELCSDLAIASSSSVILFTGLPPGYVGWDPFTGQEDRSCSDSGEIFWPSGGGDNRYAWCVCHDCGLVGIQFDGRSDRLACKECYACAVGKYCGSCAGKCFRKGANLDKGYSYSHRAIVEAAAAARSARFEHGESPSTVRR